MRRGLAVGGAEHPYMWTNLESLQILLPFEASSSL